MRSVTGDEKQYQNYANVKKFMHHFERAKLKILQSLKYL